jgi:hypothetical protein
MSVGKSQTGELLRILLLPACLESELQQKPSIKASALANQVQ